MNEKLQAFLTTLTDQELVFCAAYRKQEFIASSQVQFDQELERRGLTVEAQEELRSTTQQTDKANCIRCNARFFSDETDLDIVQRGFELRERETITRRCLICGLNPDKHPSKEGLSWWQRLFGVYRYRRIK